VRNGETVDGESLIDVEGSVGLLLGDMVMMLGLSSDEQKRFWARNFEGVYPGSKIPVSTGTGKVVVRPAGPVMLSLKMFSHLLVQYLPAFVQIPFSM
jgi:hypothetical protein